MAGWRVVAGVSLLLGGVFAGAPGAGAQAASSEVDVSIAAVSEDDGKAIVTVRSHCTNDVVVQYQTGRSAPNPSRSRKDSFDARGPQASEGVDYLAATGSFIVSSSRPFTFEVAVTDDDLAESVEHVLILFTHRQPTSGGTDVGGTTYFCDPVEATSEHTVESAFTIVDDDDDDDAATGASSAASPAMAAGPSEATSRTGTAGPGPVGPAVADPTNGSPLFQSAPVTAKPTNVTPTTAAGDSATSAASPDLRSDEELPEAEGLELVGAAVPIERVGSVDDPGAARDLIVTVAALATVVTAVAVASVRRRRSRW